MSSKIAVSRLLAIAVAIAACFVLLAHGITREVPYGGLTGTVRMAENGKLLPNAVVYLRADIDWDRYWRGDLHLEEEPVTYSAATNEEGRYYLGSVKAGRYLLDVRGDVHKIQDVRVEVKEGKPEAVDVELEPTDPYLEVYASQHVFTPGQAIEFNLHGFSKKETSEIRIYELPFASVVAKEGLQTLLQSFRQSWKPKGLDPSQAGKLVSKIEKPNSGRDVEGVFRMPVHVDKLNEGLYWLECSTDGMMRGTWFVVSKIGLVTKIARNDAACYVVDLVSGKPIAGATISSGQSGKAVKKGQTDADGTFSYKIQRSGSRKREVVLAQHGNSWAVADSYLDSQSEGSQVTTYMYSDRPIYRPGDTVEFKGITRILRGSTYEVAANKPVSIEVRDEDSNLLAESETTTSDMGSFTGQFVTNKEMAPGDYYVEAVVAGRTESMVVTLAAYRKPTYQIKVTPEKPTYIMGEKARFIVEAQYYFGGPVVGAEVIAYVDRQALWTYGDGEQDDEYGYSYGGEYFNEYKAVTDSNGRAVIEFDTKRESDFDRPVTTTDYTYNLTASVSDPGGKYFDGTGSVKVARGQFDIHVENDQYVVEKGTPVSYKITATDSLTGKPMSGLPIKARFGREFWNGKDYEFQVQESRSLVTDASGVVRAQFTPKTAGDYQFRAEATDDKRNLVQGSDYVWVAARGFDFEGVKPEENLSLKLDKKQYKPGETAKVVVRTSMTGSWAWLTIEADSIYMSKVVRLDDPVMTLEVPVTQALTPNAYVSVCLIKDKSFRSRSRRIAVDLGAKKLNVSIASDKSVYLPGEIASYTVTTKKTDGSPVPADVSLGVVDESIYALASDRTDIAAGFFPTRYNNVDTSYSFPEVYLDGGDKAPSSITVRRVFRDTAFWAPFVRTGADGTASVSFKLPDNLTSWRATAVGITANTEVGQATQNVRARRPLMVRLEAPSFWVQSDKQRLIAAVTNDSGRDADVNLELTVEGAKVEGDLRQKQRIRNGETKAFEWTAEATTSGSAVFVAKTWIDANTTDGVELRVPILPHARQFVDYSAGILNANASMKFTLRQGFDPSIGGAEVSLTPSLGTTIYQAIDELVRFPYGCVEQTLSRFVPCLVASKMTAAKGLNRPARFSEAEQWVNEGLSRLSALQHSDGSWGWWEYDTGDPFMTAMVIEALSTAKRAGYNVSENSLSRGLEWAAAHIKTPMPEIEKNKFGTILNQYEFDEELRGRIYLCYGLTLHGARAVAEGFLTNLDLSKLGSIDSANAALAFNNMGANFVKLRDTALNRMLALGSETPNLMTWKEDCWGYETTGKALMTLSTIRPADPRLDKIVVGLMLARRGATWYSTRDTNFILMGMMNVWQRQTEVAPNLSVSIRVNGKEAGKLTLNQTYWSTPLQSVTIPTSKMRQGENTVELVPSGQGSCYYTVTMKQFVYQKALGSLNTDSGFTVTRNYYRIVPRKMEDGSYQLKPDKDPVESLKRGDTIYCVVKVKTNDYRQYVIVEDPLPSNCIVTERDVVEDPEEWRTWAWYDKLVIRSDRVAFFTRWMEAGEHTFTYSLRAENPGVASALPTVAYNMYDTDKRASSAENRIEVRR
ncbi:MAG: carboxypeptidase regulatory-like domain-containing protein [Fimbriimonadaceae bacterium]|nr:carboxypeptidase regulatory-like domain-containing protein [Fimbriimonadaceae bacterium]